MTVRFTVILSMLCWLASGTVAAAAGKSLERKGIRFTEASENVRLVALSGDGTLNNPFVLTEEISGESEAVLYVEILSPMFGSRVNSNHAVGFALRKVVTNRSRHTWNYFSIELEFLHGQGSDYYDGLSFAQSATANRPFRSNRFSHVDDITEPRDLVRFTDGKVAPGQAADFLVSVTYTGQQPKFLLVQHIRRPYAERLQPAPLDPRRAASMMTCGGRG